MSRVLLTGATGLIGRNTIAPLLAAGHEVHAVARAPEESVSGVTWHPVDLLDGDAAALLLDAVRPEELVHLAWYAEHGRFWTSPENLRWVGATLELLRRFAEEGGRRAVMAGTCAEYDWSEPGDGDPPRLREGSSPLRPATLYGASKHATRLVAEAFASQAGVELAWGRVFFLYGPGEQPGRLVPALARGLLAGERTATSDGGQRRDFMHVRDVGGAFAALLDSGVEGPVNIATGAGLPVRAVVEAIAAEVGSPELVAWGALPRPDGDPDALVADVARLRDEVGFVPAVPLEEGLRETVAWWRERGDA